MTAAKKVTRAALVALAANWRSEGEYWCGTPEDARSQHCADQLLQLLGLSKDTHAVMGEDFGSVLDEYGITHHTEPPDRGHHDGQQLDFMEQAAVFEKEIFEELDDLTGAYAAGGRRARSRETVVGEKLTWAWEVGYQEGFTDGAHARKKRYKRPPRKK